MITELVITATVAATYKYLKTSDLREISRKFDNIMSETKIKNESKQTYSLFNLKSTNYGFSACISIPNGMDIDSLIGIKQTLETNMQCLIEIEKDNFKNHAYMKIITNPLNNLTYVPIKTKAYEIFIGYQFDGKPMILNMNKFPHLLVAGTIGSGKSRVAFIMLTTLLHNHSEKEIVIYLAQIRKKDLNKFRDCKQVKFCADTLEETALMLERLDKLVDKRSEMLDKAAVENIFDYNKISKIKMKYVYIFADEISFYMPDNGDTDQEKELKEKCLSKLKNIIKSSRSVGIFVEANLQRSTVDNLPSTIKSQMNRLTFHQKSEIDSNNIINIKDAIYLKEQECILDTNKYYWLKTPYIDNSIINNVLNLKTTPQEIKSEEKIKQSYSWHIPTKEEWNKIKDTLEDMTYIPPIEAPKEMTISEPIQEEPKQEVKPYIRHKRSGVIPLKEIKNA